ncbi:MAG TPA: capreomycidine synthase [Thermoanaerobaculia bacterium]
MKLPSAALEEWMRKYYFAVEYDIGSSGVQNFSLAELRHLLAFTQDDLDRIVLRDSQTFGGAELRRAIAERWLPGREDRVLVTHGSSEANFLVMNTLLEPGDEVVVQDPSYPQLYAIAETIGCRLKHWPLRFENGFRPDLDEARKLIGPRTRMVVVNFPHNPTGATLAEEEQLELVRLVERMGAYLLWDAAFCELTYDRPTLPDPAVLYDRALSLGTLSKAYGLPGLRVGWCLAAEELLERLVRMRDYMTLHLSPLVEFIAERAIRGADRLVALRREQAYENRSKVGEWVAANRDLVEWVPPEGGVCAFVRFPHLADTTNLCHRLACEQKVLLVPGSCFLHPRYVRLGFGDSPEAVGQGLRRLSRLLPCPLSGSGETVASVPVPAPGRITTLSN